MHPLFKRQKTAIPDCPTRGFARQFGLDPLIFEVAVANLIGSATHDLLGGQYAVPDEAANLKACETAANARDCSIKRFDLMEPSPASPPVHHLTQFRQISFALSGPREREVKRNEARHARVADDYLPVCYDASSL
ncbi:hypothetical protein [Mesorhizobium sp. M0244]|uniref:hypothetical protein n=1 Tax=Mesorhizobium sp. M0244 TaxID=2956926 RepID=UPI0033387825